MNPSTENGPNDPPVIGSRARTLTLAGLGLAMLLAGAAGAYVHTPAHTQATPAIGWLIPFATLLAAIALGPFIHRHGWEKYYPVVAGGLGLISLGYYLFVAHDISRWVVGMQDYLSFIVLLGALFIVSGGIVVHVAKRATPAANTLLLLFGAVIANLFGTTGASMLLIRPYLRMNRDHIKPYHVVFFIFIVSNVGGALTPVGDPPLFLGYLQGVPFWWVFEHCWPLWAMAIVALLAIFFVIDHRDHRRYERKLPAPVAIKPGADEAADRALSDARASGIGEERAQEIASAVRYSAPAVSIHGIHNLLLIMLVVAAVFQEGLFDSARHGLEHGWTASLILHTIFSREGLMLAAAVASLRFTPPHVHIRNEFSYAPIREVAILFAGIFSTMTPALQYLKAHAGDMPLQTPGHYYFATGVMSSTLDNAPTYETFLEVKLGEVVHSNPSYLPMARAELKRIAAENAPDAISRAALSPDLPPVVRQAVTAMLEYHPRDVVASSYSLEELEVSFLLRHPDLSRFLVAISIGAVFFGACTYIGNGPNFMVKSLSEASGVKTPGFIRYILFYALPILVPLYIVLWAIYFR